MALNNIVKIYSNDGSTLLFTSSETVGVAASQTVTETGITLSNGEVYIYEGNKKFLGIATTVNQITPDYAVGSTFSYSAPIYIVEEELPEEESKTPTFTYDLTKLNLSAGTYSIVVVAKAAGYNDAPSNTAQFIVEQESFVEETNEYGTTMVINKYTEEPNEYGTTMIIGGETTTNLISFTIEGTTYQAEEGMTYAQWVDSKYNTGSYYTNGTFLYNSGGQAVGTSPNMAVSNVIEQGDALNTFTGGAG